MRRPAGRVGVAGLLFAAGLAAGCGPAVVGGGAATVGVLGAQSRTYAQAASDAKIRAQINDAWLQANERMYRLVSLQVWNGRVLVSGVVPDEEMRLTAIEGAWQAEGVKDVINEVRVGETGGAGTFSQDAWITAQLKSKLTFDKQINGANYSIDTVHGVIYLLGTAETEAELDQVIAHARNIGNVARVVSHIKIAGEDDPKPARPAAPPREPRPGEPSM